MSKLEDLVPPLELCKKLPDGAFADSCYVRPDDVPGNPVWMRDGRVYYHELRCGIKMYPAPTLAEIMDALANEWQCPNLHLHKSLRLNRIVGYVTAGLDASRDIDNDTSETAALRLWLDLNKEKKSEKIG